MSGAQRSPRAERKQRLWATGVDERLPQPRLLSLADALRAAGRGLADLRRRRSRACACHLGSRTSFPRVRPLPLTSLTSLGRTYVFPAHTSLTSPGGSEAGYPGRARGGGGE